MPTYRSYEEAFNAVSEVLVELRGRLEAHRYSQQVLAVYLQECVGPFSASQFGDLVRRIIPAISTVTDHHSDPTSKVQYKALTDELATIADLLSGPTPPELRVISGGKSGT